MIQHKILKPTAFLFLISFIMLNCNAKHLPESYYNETTKAYACKASKVNIDFLLDTIRSNTITDTALLACCYHQIGVKFYKKRDYIKSIQYNEIAAELRKKYNDGLYWKSLRNLGYTYRKLKNYSRAVKYFDKTLQANENMEPKYEIQILMYLADVLSEIGEYERSKALAMQAIKIKTNNYYIAQAHNILSKIIIATKDSLKLDLAIYNAKQAIKKNEKESTKVTALNELGNAYMIKKKYHKSIAYYQKALNLSIDNIVDQALFLSNIASAYNELKEYKKSINLLNSSLSLWKKYFGNIEFNFSYYITYRNIANNYEGLEKLDSALFFYQKSLTNLTNQFRKENIFKNPQFNDSLFIYSKPYLIEVLDLKAIAALEYYKKGSNEKYLNLAEQTYQTLLDFHSQLQQDISTENSRLLQANKIVPFIEQALEISYAKQKINNFDAQATFRLMEKNKATVLSQLMNEGDALLFANLPDSLREREQDQKIAIAFYERRLNDAQANGDTITIINELENDLYKNKEGYHSLINNLEENYPDYYQFKYQQKETTLAEVQSKLNEETAMLEYFVGKNHIYIFGIQNNQTKLYQIEKPKDWDKRINVFVGVFNGSSLSNDLQSPTEVNRFTDQATFFYETLLQQPLADLDNNITHLQIIPDAELNYIPFDVLFYEKTDTTPNLNFSNLPYLIKQKAIGYAYSANLWLDNLKTEPLQNPITYGGYASQHSFEEEDADLPIARKQVQSIAELFKGKSYLADTATKSAFLDDQNAYNILHFAMHGKVNDTLPLNSHLVFTKTDSLNKLYAADLYNTKLQTDLAVLGACNTGTGKVQKGEGVMSLSRAFTYAGCPSLVMSLWSIPDVSSAKVLDGFFTNLKDGLSKDVALQQAKLSFLETSEKSHPLYWAGLVAVGNLEPLILNVPMYPNWLPIVFVCLFVCILVFITKRYFLK